MNVINLKIPSPLGNKLAGHEIHYQGRVIPRLRGKKIDNSYAIILDNRWEAIIPEEHIHPVLMLLANALAVGEGYSNAEANTKDKPFAPLAVLLQGGCND